MMSKCLLHWHNQINKVTFLACQEPETYEIMQWDSENTACMGYLGLFSLFSFGIDMCLKLSHKCKKIQSSNSYILL